MTTFDNARLGASTSKSPLTICRSGAIPRRKSYVSLSVRLPRQRIWPILPGVRSFLNCEKGGKGVEDICLAVVFHKEEREEGGGEERSSTFAGMS